jgi:hypothetical protein
LGAAEVAWRAGPRYAPLAPLIFMILHFVYGLGNLVGIWHFLILRGKRLRKAEDHSLGR